MSTGRDGPRPSNAGFPDDLVALQQHWTRLFNRLAASPPPDGRAMRAELLRTGLRIDAHPHWAATVGGWSRTARRELQLHAARAPGGEPLLVTRCVDGRIVAVPPDAP
ncbi:hypothetical protein [Streptomyces sp. NPDC057939]|uniref:hypothetical protein n=1 Tax=Streptomyces sp. NPDC057939 TaxID=3346284 RepID=UPI0036E84DED